MSGTIEKTSVVETILNIIPTNPIKGLADGNMLQIILFAIIIGIILAKLGEKVEVVSNFFAQFNDIMMEMTNMIMKLGTCRCFLSYHKNLFRYRILSFHPAFKIHGQRPFKPRFPLPCHLCGTVFHIYAVESVPLYKKIPASHGFAFSTATSNATIPLAIETLKEKMGVSKKISSFTIPLGATVNMDGTAIMQGVAVVFASQAFGIPLTPTDYATVILTATLASIGTAGVPSVGLITLTMGLRFRRPSYGSHRAHYGH